MSARRRLKHCSHQLGVHPAYRNLGLGFLLKRFQWEFVRDQGIELITWTYDPLLSTNAYLNIARLGAVCNTYRRNEYGDLNDDLNAGLPDRSLPGRPVGQLATGLRGDAGDNQGSRFSGDGSLAESTRGDGSVLPPDGARLAALQATATGFRRYHRYPARLSGAPRR